MPANNGNKMVQIPTVHRLINYKRAKTLGSEAYANKDLLYYCFFNVLRTERHFLNIEILYNKS